MAGRVSSNKTTRHNVMVMDRQHTDRARAYPTSDTHGLRSGHVISERGLHGQGRARLTKRVQQRRVKEMRVGTINIGTLNGKSREIADLMDRRRLDILCLQETRWKGEKSKDLAGGHKLIYIGETGRNGVAIVLSNDIRGKLVQVNRKSERVISVKLSERKTNLTVISAYAPQVGCEDIEKDQFWTELEEEVNLVPE